MYLKQVAPVYVKVCSMAALNDNIDISRIQTFAHNLEDRRFQQRVTERIVRE